MAGAHWFVTMMAGVVMAAPVVSAEGLTGSDDFVGLRMSHDDNYLTENYYVNEPDLSGLLAVIAPGGQAVLLADDGWTCHSLSSGCESWIDVPPGTEASGIWSVAFVPEKNHQLTSYYCLIPLPMGACFLHGFLPSDPYLRYDLSVTIAGWEVSHAIHCTTTTGAVWALDYDARQVTAACAPLTDLPFPFI